MLKLKIPHLECFLKAVTNHGKTLKHMALTHRALKDQLSNKDPVFIDFENIRKSCSNLKSFDMEVHESRIGEDGKVSTRLSYEYFLLISALTDCFRSASQTSSTVQEFRNTSTGVQQH